MKQVFERLLPWYRARRRPLPWREGRDPYRIYLSEIMLQQTRIEAVIPYYFRFLENLPTLKDLAACPEEKLMKLWEGLGYYSRARNLQKCARIVTEKYGGELPRDYDALLNLPGIGEYTAGAIASIAFGLSEPAVDGNVLRVIARITGDERDVLDPRTRKDVREKLKQDYPAGEDACDLTQGLMELGEVVCLPNGAPLCDACPVKELCRAQKDGSWSRIPVRAPKPEKKKVEKTVFLLCHHDRFAVRRREEPGLLHGLFEFPNLDGHLTVEEAAERLAKLGLAPGEPTALKPGKHIFTHLEWRMTGFFVPCGNATADYLWKTPEELRREIALPTAFRPFLKQIKE